MAVLMHADTADPPFGSQSLGLATLPFAAPVTHFAIHPPFDPTNFDCAFAVASSHLSSSEVRGVAPTGMTRTAIPAANAAATTAAPTISLLDMPIPSFGWRLSSAPDADRAQPYRVRARAARCQENFRSRPPRRLTTRGVGGYKLIAPNPGARRRPRRRPGRSRTASPRSPGRGPP